METVALVLWLVNLDAQLVLSRFTSLASTSVMKILSKPSALAVCQALCFRLSALVCRLTSPALFVAALSYLLNFHNTQDTHES